jgi:hypothetical protein
LSTQVRSISCALVLGLVFTGAAQSASDHDDGDGSNFDNAQLIPGTPPNQPVLVSGAALREPYHPFFDIDWSVAIRGSYTHSTEGDRLEQRLLPSVTLTHEGTRSNATVDASADLVRAENGHVDVTALRLGVGGSYQLDSLTEVTLRGDIEKTHPVPGTPGVATDIAYGPAQLSGELALGVERQFGRFNVGFGGSVARDSYGPTWRTDGSVTDNRGQDLWAVDGTLRLGFQATPIFEVFGVAGIGRDLFDTADPLTGIRPDATDTSLRGGITGRWNDILEATASAGLGWRHLDDASFADTETQLYDASITFTPDPTWRLTAGLSTTLAPPGPDGSGDARVEYQANAELGYTVNSWLALRAGADWSTTHFIGSDETESGFGWGVGADYAVNDHTALTADYDYDFGQSTADGEQAAHRMSLGITLSR